MRRFFIPLLCVTLCYAWPGALAQDTTTIPSVTTIQVGDNDTVPVLQYPNNPVSDILSLYEKLTGKVLIRDASLASAGSLSVVSTQPMSKAEAIHLIEASLLLNGFTLVPTGENQVKVIFTFPTAKNPRSEGVPLFSNTTDLPQGNQ